MQLGELREGLDPLQFIAGPLEHVRSFLGRLYSWACTGRRYARPCTPPMMLRNLKFLVIKLKRCRMTECSARTKDVGELFRLDAKAEGEEVAIGGWRCAGIRQTREAAWFAVRLSSATPLGPLPGGEPFKTIAILKLLDALVGLMASRPRVAGARRGDYRSDSQLWDRQPRYSLSPRQTAHN